MAVRTDLPPYPNGWFVFGFSDELRPEALLSRQFMGQRVVVFRTRSGKVVASEAYCPHLGAHFGSGGRVEGELLRCPFHGFSFDDAGACGCAGRQKAPPP
jgi:phenylpropionate dioxygenase-like ring-hydroxylating dioxygenase large terminal subunit